MNINDLPANLISMRCPHLRPSVAAFDGRVYSAEAIDRIISQSNKASESRTCLLVSELPPSYRIRLVDVVGLVSSATVEAGEVTVMVHMLDTNNARLLLPEFDQVTTVTPVIFGIVNEAMMVDPDSIMFNGWALVWP